MTSKQWDRNLLALGQAALERLHRSTVAIVGLGSLGSPIAKLLAENGVGNFILMDPDELSEENIPRHECGRRYLGWKKVDAVKDVILDKYPEANVKALTLDVLQEYRQLASADLVLVCGLGSEMATAQLAAQLRKMGKPALFGRAFQRAKAGDVFFVHPSEGACYSCFAVLVCDMQPVIQREIRYDMMPDELKAQPGLATDIIHIAVMMAQWATVKLVNDPQLYPPYPGNYIIMTNTLRHKIGLNDDGSPNVLRPFSSTWFNIPPQEGCLICGVPETPQTLSNIDDIL